MKLRAFELVDGKLAGPGSEAANHPLQRAFARRERRIDGVERADGVARHEGMPELPSARGEKIGLRSLTDETRDEPRFKMGKIAR